MIEHKNKITTEKHNVKYLKVVFSMEMEKHVGGHFHISCESKQTDR